MMMNKALMYMLLVAAFLFFLANHGQAALPCNDVNAKAAPCIGFASGMQPKPLPTCCNGLKQLAGSVKNVEDKKTICRCLKAGAASLRVQDKFLSMLPQLCNINVGFPISTKTNCETIH